MSYQEKNITVSAVSAALILVFFLANCLPMYFDGGLDSVRVFTLTAVVILAGILANIFSSILTNILLSILHAIRTGTSESERFIADERDHLIELKGMRVSYIVFSVGVLGAMASFVVGQPALVMFSLIIVAAFVAEIVGSLWQIGLYRRGG